MSNNEPFKTVRKKIIQSKKEKNWSSSKEEWWIALGPPIFNFLFNSLLVLSLMLIAGKLRSQWEREREVWGSVFGTVHLWPCADQTKHFPLEERKGTVKSIPFLISQRGQWSLKGLVHFLYSHTPSQLHIEMKTTWQPIQYNTAHFHKLHIHHIITTPHQHHQHILPHINRVKKKTSHG